ALVALLGEPELVVEGHRHRADGHPARQRRDVGDRRRQQGPSLQGFHPGGPPAPPRPPRQPPAFPAARPPGAGHAALGTPVHAILPPGGPGRAPRPGRPPARRTRPAAARGPSTSSSAASRAGLADISDSPAIFSGVVAPAAGGAADGSPAQG